MQAHHVGIVNSEPMSSFRYSGGQTAHESGSDQIHDDRLRFSPSVSEDLTCPRTFRGTFHRTKSTGRQGRVSKDRNPYGRHVSLLRTRDNIMARFARSSSRSSSPDGRNGIRMDAENTAELCFLIRGGNSRLRLNGIIMDAVQRREQQTMAAAHGTTHGRPTHGRPTTARNYAAFRPSDLQSRESYKQET